MISSGSPTRSLRWRPLFGCTVVISAVLFVRPALAQLPADDGVAAAGVEAPGPAAVPVPPWLVSRLDRVVKEGIREGITPGASLVIGFGGHVALSRSWGRLDWDESSSAVTDSSVYDLASVTKAMVTTTAAMRLVEEGQLDLDVPVSTYLPGWPSSGTKGRISARHLLSHTSGLPAAARLWRSNRGRDAYLGAIADLSLRGNPGEVEVYSDLGMIVLGLAVEKIAGEPLNVLAGRWVIEPLGLRETAFEPLEAGFAKEVIAPTELDPRSGVKTRGTVHDANAHAMGGVAGHAGLFGSARDLATFAGSVLWEAPEPLACVATIKQFAHREDPSARFGLGWEMPVPEVIWSDFFTDNAFGHTGFTGTSLWIDPDHDLFVVFLTNRLNSKADEERIHDLRRWVHRAVHGWIVDPMSAPAAARAAAERSEPTDDAIGEVCESAGPDV
jgi:CubicO group peptidase (beta-lactamase class C family)